MSGMALPPFDYTPIVVFENGRRLERAPLGRRPNCADAFFIQHPVKPV
jgi:hypothetical protein